MYLPHIDGLRALAVLAVMVAHYALPLGTGGFLGVDVFFVISGFLITRLIAQEQAEGRFSYRRFYLRRVRRLLPAALSVIALTLLAFVPILSANDLADLLKSVPAAILPAANLYYYSTVGYFDTAAIARPLLHFWSLAVEEQFYFLWPTLLLAALTVLPKRVTALGMALLIASLIGAEWIRGQSVNAAYYLLPFRAFELMVGAQLALIMRARAGARHYLPAAARPDPKSAAWAALGLTMVVISFVVADKTSPLPGLWSLVPCLGTALLIRFGAHGPVGRILQHRAVVWIGLISYSLYLVHWPIYVYLAYRLPSDPSLALKLALFPLAIALAAANYYAVETRWRRPARRDARFGNWPVLAGIAVAACLLVVPTAVKYKDRGFGIRSQDAVIAPPAEVAKRTQIPWEAVGQGRSLRIYRPRSGPADGPRVLLLGDSHAGHLETGLVHLLIPQGATLEAATLPGCPPLFAATRHFDVPDRAHEIALCRTASQGVKEQIATQGGYDAVILAARWYNMVEDSPFGDLARRHDRLVRPDAPLPPDDPKTSLHASRTLFATALDQTLGRLSQAGIPTVIFSQVPELGHDLSRCMTLFPWARATGHFAPGSRCAQMPSAAKRARARFTDTLIAETSARHGALAVSPSALFCATPDTPCFTVDYTDEWKLMFRDSNHLSRKGSVDLIRAADTQLGLSAFLAGNRAPRAVITSQTAAE